MTQPDSPVRVAMVQDGARLHYAVPIALQRAGLLQAMFTDWFSSPGRVDRLLAHAAKPVRHPLAGRMANRYHAELDPARIVSMPWQTIRFRRRRKRFAGDANWYAHQAQAMADRVLARAFGDANLLHGFIRNLAPTLPEAAHKAGLRATGDQIIAPATVELAEMNRQRELFPDWQRPGTTDDLQRYVEWEHATWQALDHVTCPSTYVRDGLVAQGIDPSKISVLPYPIDAGAWQVATRQDRRGPLTVGFIGSVGLRKGAPWFFQVAQHVHHDYAGVRFVMVGPIDLDLEAIAPHRGRVELVGPVPRADVQRWLDRFDLLLFPSTCEGSAGAVMEAMAAGLPVVTSPNAGSVIRDGIDGFIHAYDDVDGMASRVLTLLSDGNLRTTIGQAARKRAMAFNLDWYSRELATVLTRAAQGDGGER